MRAPFPYFGGKSRVADVVWRELGADVPNYVEPFAGSLAVLLARPGGAGKVETVNDLDGYVANFWRALAWAPDEVAHHADWPVNEADLHARHAWLVERRGDLTERLMGDPRWFDSEAAGWWLWGTCAWIGSGWCSGKGPWHVVDGRLVKGDAGRGINRQLPHLGDAGVGINRKLPHLAQPREINTRGAWDADGLCQRLRRVRVACGDWRRVLGENVTNPNRVIGGVFLDPPYDEGAGYSCGGGVAADVWAWACEHGDNPGLRIAVCGYDDGREVPAGWRGVSWKAKGGYGSQGDGAGRENAARERIWLSPHCLGSNQMEMF